VPIARGWERQIDRRVNPEFYDPARPLTADAYRDWLHRNGVTHVALSDALPDPWAWAETDVVRAGQPYLHEVWHDAHWRVYAVAGARPLAGGAARATAVETERVRLTASRPGVVDLRVRFTPYWRIAAGRGCVGQGPGGWTRLRVDRPGPVVLEPSFALGRVRASAPRCTG